MPDEAPIPQTHNERIDEILDFIQRSSWHFEDNGREDNVCYECGWSKNKDQKHRGDGLSHKPDCPIPQWIEFLKNLKV